MPDRLSRQSPRCRSGRPRMSLFLLCVGACASVVTRDVRELRAGLGIAADCVTGRDVRPTVICGSLITGCVGLDDEVSAQRIERIQLLEVSALAGLAVGIAVVVDRGA